MAKKNKMEEEWKYEEIISGEENNVPDPVGDDWGDNDPPEFMGDGDITNSLQLANKTLEPSKVVSQLPEILKETRIAFLSESAAREVKHRAKNYDGIRYIRKILHLQKQEDDSLIERKRTLYKVQTEEHLKAYLKSINRFYLFEIIKDCGEMKQLLMEVQFLKPSGIADDIQKMTTDLTEHYKTYNEANDLTKDIDDSGNIQNIAIESVASSGTEGNERFALISTVQATRTMDAAKETKIEEPSAPILSTAKKVWNKFSR